MTDRSRNKRGDKTGGDRLSAADRMLWRRVIDDTRPLAKKSPPRPQDGDEAAPPPRPRKSGLPRAEPVPVVAKPPPEPELSPGQVAGVARRQAERLRRGLLPIGARLDLHGHRQDEAERELSDFLARSQATDKRCVLVVTGKGSGRAEAGVLRRMVPLWLNQPPNRGRILAFAQAQPKDGGLGALYVLLKRRRGG